MKSYVITFEDIFFTFGPINVAFQRDIIFYVMTQISYALFGIPV